MRTLVVDDDQVIGTFLSAVLSQYGECVLEDDGKKALGTFVKSIYDGEIFDLILLDIMMPEIDGLSLLKIIRELEAKWNIGREERSKIMMVTAVDSPIEAGESFIFGDVDDYIVKPVSVNELKSKMEGLFGTDDPV
jgi:two-component system chemotaxis response regulator CheY